MNKANENNMGAIAAVTLDDASLQTSMDNISTEDALKDMLIGDESLATGMIEDREVLDIDTEGLKNLVDTSGHSAVTRAKYDRTLTAIGKVQDAGLSVVKTESGRYWVEDTASGDRAYTTTATHAIKDVMDEFVAVRTDPDPDPDPNTLSDKQLDKVLGVSKANELLVNPDPANFMGDGEDEDLNMSESSIYYLTSFLSDAITTALGLSGRMTAPATGGTSYLAGGGISLTGGLFATALTAAGDYHNPKITASQMVKNIFIGAGYELFEAVAGVPIGFGARFAKAAPMLKTLVKYGYSSAKAGIATALIAGGVKDMDMFLNNIDELLEKETWSVDDWRSLSNILQISASVFLGVRNRQKAAKGMQRVNTSQTKAQTKVDQLKTGAKNTTPEARSTATHSKQENAQLYRDNAVQNSTTSQRAALESDYQKTVRTHGKDSPEAIQAAVVKREKIKGLDAQVKDNSRALADTKSTHTTTVNRANERAKAATAEVTRPRVNNHGEVKIKTAKQLEAEAIAIRGIEVNRRKEIKTANKNFTSDKNALAPRDARAEAVYTRKIQDIENTKNISGRKKLAQAEAELEMRKTETKNTVAGLDNVFGKRSSENIQGRAVAMEQGKAAGAKTTSDLRQQASDLRKAERKHLVARQDLSNHYKKDIAKKEKEIALLERKKTPESAEAVKAVRADMAKSKGEYDAAVLREKDRWSAVQLGRKAVFSGRGAASYVGSTAVRALEAVQRRVINVFLGATPGQKSAASSLVRQNAPSTDSRYDKDITRAEAEFTARRYGFVEGDIIRLSMDELRIVLTEFEKELAKDKASREAKRRGGVLVPRFSGGGKARKFVTGGNFTDVDEAVLAVSSAGSMSEARAAYAAAVRLGATDEQLTNARGAMTTLSSKLTPPDKMGWVSKLAEVNRFIKPSDLFFNRSKIQVVSPSQGSTTPTLYHSDRAIVMPGLSGIIASINKKKPRNSSGSYEASLLNTRRFNEQYREKQKYFAANADFLLKQKGAQTAIENKRRESVAYAANKDSDRDDANSRAYAQALRDSIVQAQTQRQKLGANVSNAVISLASGIANKNKEASEKTNLSFLYGKKRIYSEEYLPLIWTARNEKNDAEADRLIGEFERLHGIDPNTLDEAIYKIDGDSTNFGRAQNERDYARQYHQFYGSGPINPQTGQPTSTTSTSTGTGTSTSTGTPETTGNTLIPKPEPKTWDLKVDVPENNGGWEQFQWTKPLDPSYMKPPWLKKN